MKREQIRINTETFKNDAKKLDASHFQVSTSIEIIFSDNRMVAKHTHTTKRICFFTCRPFLSDFCENFASHFI